MRRRQYEEINAITRTDAEAAAERDIPKELAVCVVAVALHEMNRVFAQQYCLSLASHRDNVVRGNAILGFGHLARRFQEIDTTRVVPVVEAGLKDENEYVRGHAFDAADDIQHFCGNLLFLR